MPSCLLLSLVFSLLPGLSDAFSPSPPALLPGRPLYNTGNDNDNLSSLLTSRLAISVEDQVRQASEALRRATKDGKHRHSIRLLLPLIGATELDDWPGGARQMMEAANPLTQDILKTGNENDLTIQASILDESDGVLVLMAQANEAKDDSCSVLLPSSDTVNKIQSLEAQVGPMRNLILVNTQWKRKTDFGIFGGTERAKFAESFEPTFYSGNLMVEGEQIRVLRSYPGPWRVFLRVKDADTGSVTWELTGEKDLVSDKPTGWDQDPANQRDGGRLFDYGQPTYREIEHMIVSMDGYKPKSMAERAAAAFTFIKDTL